MTIIEGSRLLMALFLTLVIMSVAMFGISSTSFLIGLLEKLAK